MLKPKLAVIDLDMTITNTLRCFYRVLGEALENHGYRRPTWRRFMELFCRDELSILAEPSDMASIWEYFKHNYVPRRGESRLYEGVPAALRRLRESGVGMVVATGRSIPGSLIEEELRELGVLEFMDSIYPLGKGMGGPEIFGKEEVLRVILREHDVQPAEAVMIGDYWTDMLSSRRVGMLGIGVATGCKPRSLLRLAGAWVVMDGLWMAPQVLLP